MLSLSLLGQTCSAMFGIFDWLLIRFRRFSQLAMQMAMHDVVNNASIACRRSLHGHNVNGLKQRHRPLMPQCIRRAPSARCSARRMFIPQFAKPSFLAACLPACRGPAARAGPSMRASARPLAAGASW